MVVLGINVFIKNDAAVAISDSRVIVFVICYGKKVPLMSSDGSDVARVL